MELGESLPEDPTKEKISFLHLVLYIDVFEYGKVKTVYETSGPSGQPLSQFL